MKRQAPRVRFAPSPTGVMHLGTLRTALFNWLFARKTGGTFILRIEDTDRAREVPGTLEDIVRTLAAYGLTVDEGLRFEDGSLVSVGKWGPYRQSERLALYRQHADDLIRLGYAYRCFCSAQRLERIRKEAEGEKRPPKYDRLCFRLDPAEVKRRVGAGEPHVVRLLVPAGETLVRDLIHGEVRFANDTIDDQVLLKSDGYPTYHLANVVDDHLMGVTDVIRGDDWLPSTPKHLMLYASFSWEPPQFAHLPLILGADKAKLSKRHGAKPAGEYLKAGFLPAAVLNFIALLGWNPGTEQEVFQFDELVEAFDLDKVNRANPVFDETKLRWLNRHHLGALPEPAFVQAFVDFVRLNPIDAEEHRVSPEKIALIAKRVRSNVDMLGRFDTLADLHSFIVDHLAVPKYPKTLLTRNGKLTEKDVRDVLTTIRDRVHRVGDTLTSDDFRTMLDTLAKEKGNNWIVFWPVRIALSGREKSPPPHELADVILSIHGAQSLSRRLEAAIGKVG